MPVVLLDGKPLLNMGKVAMSEDCCCGDPSPGCNVPILYCDQISISKSKCGHYSLRVDDEHYYTDVVWNPVTETNDYSGPSGPFKIYRSIDVTFGNWDDTTPLGEEAGSINVTATLEFDCVTETGYSCDGEITLDEVTYWTCADVYQDIPLDLRVSHEMHTPSGGETHLSVEYTTEELIDNAIAALPEFDDDFDDGCVASRDLSSPDESSVSISRVRYKFRFTPPDDTRGYEINWVERFTPNIGDPSDTPKSFTWDGSNPGMEQDTEVHDLNETAENGANTVAGIRYSCPEPL